ncbi:MAG: putative AIG1 family protein [Streblomastix strix]|uniref:Putative AIG1 family protein n=1 Tax=Streblomastix strix TaxID=222440 RepID=A0A5J4X5C5_9EUKA|nr:MAG: putative AIG1 family protein [Streblomastix strix]
MSVRKVVLMVIGDTGTGKSSFGNLYLGRPAFKESDSPAPVTLESTSASSVVDGITRTVIDTEGLSDGQNSTAEQVQKLALFLRGWNEGVNAIGVCLNGQHDRFSQSVKDIIRFAYNAFGTKEALGHIFIVFTNCFAFLPNKPNCTVKTTEYQQYVQNFLKEISGAPQVPEIPIFFVDTQDADGYETKQSMIQIHGFALERQPMDSRGFKAVPIHDKIDEQFQVGVFVDYEYEGDTRYKKLIDRKRQKITPYNGDDIRYSNWDIIKSYREAFGTRSRRTETRQRSQEKKNVTHHSAHSIFGSSSNDHTHWEIVKSTWTEARDIITDFDGRVTESDWRIVPGTNKDQIIDSGRNGGWSQGWVHSDNIKA